MDCCNLNAECLNAAMFLIFAVQWVQELPAHNNNWVIGEVDALTEPYHASQGCCVQLTAFAAIFPFIGLLLISIAY